MKLTRDCNTCGAPLRVSKNYCEYCGSETFTTKDQFIKNNKYEQKLKLLHLVQEKDKRLFLSQ